VKVVRPVGWLCTHVVPLEVVLCIAVHVEVGKQPKHTSMLVLFAVTFHVTH
jgi:hypothetical protein